MPASANDAPADVDASSPASVGRPVRISQYLTRDRRGLATLVVTSAVMAVISAALPVALSRGLDVARNGSSAEAAALSGVVLAIGVVVWLLNRLRARLGRNVVAAAVLDIRHDAMASVLGRGLDYLDRHPPGSLLSRVVNDVESIADAVMAAIEQLHQVVFMAVLLPLLFVIEWRLGLVTAVSGAVIVALTRAAGRYAGGRAGDAAEASARLTTEVRTAVRGLRTARAFGVEDAVVERALAVNADAYARIRRHELAARAIQPLLLAVAGATLALLVLVGGQLERTGLVTLSAWYLFLLAFERFTVPLSTLAGMAGLLSAAHASSRRVVEIVAPDLRERPDRPNPPTLRGGISVDGVSMHYPNGVHALRSVSLDVAAGEHVGLVGPSGAGKSTLLKVIARLQPFDLGRLALDGTPLAEVPEDVLRRSVAYVPQHPRVFAGTIADNVRMSAPELDDDAIHDLAKPVGLDRWLASLPDGLATPTTAGGQSLSLGERQLVAFLRAVVKRPTIVLLDEPSANLDPGLERLVRAAMDVLLSNATCVVIAHRLETVRTLPRIAVMRQGRIVETASYQTLVAAGNGYAALLGSLFDGSPVEH